MLTEIAVLAVVGGLAAHPSPCIKSSSGVESCATMEHPVHEHFDQTDNNNVTVELTGVQAVGLIGVLGVGGDIKIT